MTFLQPKKDKNFLIRLAIFSIIPFVLAVFSLVITYNQVVNLDHEIARNNKEIESSQAATAELKEKIFSFFNTNSVEKVIRETGLIQDKTPEYFEDSQKWAFALQ